MIDDLRRIAHQVFILAPSPQLRYQRRGRYAVTEGVVFSAYDWPDPSNSTAAVAGDAPPLDRVLDLARAFFGVPEGAWSIVVEAGAGHPLERELQARGWRIIEQEPALVLPRITTAPPLPAGLSIRRVDSEAALHDFWRVSDLAFAEGEEAPPEEPSVAQAFLPSLACALDADMAYFVGYAGDEAVATSGLCRIDQVAEVVGVSTLVAYRRRGIGAALTWAAIGEGVARGCTCAALRATPLGYPVYRRMGFQPACAYRTYVPA